MSNVIAMPDWATRKTAGDAHEQTIREQLRARNWFVSEWGQGVLHPAVRSVLRTIKSPFCYEPDMIAVRGCEIAVIDGKGTVSGGPSYTINRRSLAALRRFAAYHDLPVYCVFDDLRVLTPEEVVTAAGLTRLDGAGAYLRVPRGLGRPFDAVFGARSRAGLMRQQAAA